MKKTIIIISLIIVLLLCMIFTACTEEKKMTGTYISTKCVNSEGFNGVKADEDELKEAIEEYPITLKFEDDVVKETSYDLNLETNEFEEETHEYNYVVDGDKIVITVENGRVPAYEEEYVISGDTLVIDDGTYVTTFTLQ